MNKPYKKLSSLICIAGATLLTATPFIGTPALANSAQSSWHGTDGMGLIVTDEDCPVTVEKEILTFDLQEFPKNYYDSEEEYLAYPGRVTAEYTFYNPADYNVTATLIFPFGKVPNYAYYEYDNGYKTADDVFKYNVTSNGGTVDKNVRYTAYADYRNFNCQALMKYMSDDYVEDEYFTPGLPVTKYVYEFDVDTGEYLTAWAAIDIPAYDGKHKIWFEDSNGFNTLKNGVIRAGGFVRYSQTMTLYVFGEGEYELPEWKFYKDGGAKDKDRISGTARLSEKEPPEEMTFREFALERRDAEDCPDVDWYNAFLYNFRENGFRTSNATLIYGSDNVTLMRWYEYELIIGAGQRVQNSVTAPIYPTINSNYIPTVYEYEYYLSPASCWAEFGGIEININTSYYIIESRLNTFKKTANGYKYTANGLPQGECVFSLSTSETVKERWPFGTTTRPYIVNKKGVIWVSVAAGASLIVGAAIALGVIFGTKKK